MRRALLRLRAGTNPLVMSFARGVSASFVAKVFGALITFATHIALARMLGSVEYGIYAFVFTWVVLLVLVARLGMDVTLMRFLPQYASGEQWGLLRGIARSAFRYVGVSSLVLAVVAGAGFAIGSRLPGAGWVWAGVAGVALIPALAIAYVVQGALRGLMRAGLAEVLDSVTRPLLLLAVTAAVWLSTRQVTAVTALLAHTAAAATAVAAGILVLRRALPEASRLASPDYRHREWMGMAFPLVAMGSMNLVLDQIDIVMLGIYRGPEQAGIYSAATRIASQTVFFVSALDVVLAPVIARLFAAADRAELQRIITIGAWATAAFTLPAVLVLAGFGKPLLGLYGAEFGAGYVPLLVLLAAKVVNALTGSVGAVLSMTGNHAVAARVIAVAAIVNVGLNAILVPRFGMVGAAAATAFSIMLWNVAMFLEARRRVGLNTTIFAGLPRIA